jgi:hypothetical protein
VLDSLVVRSRCGNWLLLLRGKRIIIVIFFLIDDGIIRAKQSILTKSYYFCASAKKFAGVPEIARCLKDDIIRSNVDYKLT